MALSVCPACSRHVRSEPACPFCGAPRPTGALPLGGVLAAVTLGLVACGGSPAQEPSTAARPPEEPVRTEPQQPLRYAEPPPPSDAPPSEPPPAEPSPVPSLDGVLVPPPSEVDPRAAAAYGAPPVPSPSRRVGQPEPSLLDPGTRESTKVAGTVEVSLPVVTGKLSADPAVPGIIQRTRAGLRACYQKGLQADPTAAGVVEFKIHVTDSGTIKRVESANPPNMPGSVTSCMVGRFGALSFNAAGASTIDVKVSCQPER